MFVGTAENSESINTPFQVQHRGGLLSYVDIIPLVSAPSCVLIYMNISGHTLYFICFFFSF